MAIAFEIGICDLLTEFLADALILLGALKSAGAIAAGTLQAFPNRGNHFLIFIQTHSHDATLLKLSMKKALAFASALVGEAGLEPARP